MSVYRVRVTIHTELYLCAKETGELDGQVMHHLDEIVSDARYHGGVFDVTGHRLASYSEVPEEHQTYIPYNSRGGAAMYNIFSNGDTDGSDY